MPVLLAPGVSLNPASNAENAVQAASANVVPLTLTGAAAQSASLQEWKNNVGAVLCRIDNTGLLETAQTGNATKWIAWDGTSYSAGTYCAIELNASKNSWHIISGVGAGGVVRDFIIRLAGGNDFVFNTRGTIIAPTSIAFGTLPLVLQQVQTGSQFFFAISTSAASKQGIFIYSTDTTEQIAYGASNQGAYGFPDWQVSTHGKMQWASNGNPPDCNLYHSLAGQIATDTAFGCKGLMRNLVTKTASYSATTTDDFIIGDATGGGITITLPTAVGATGKTYTVKKKDGSVNTVTVATTGGQTIDGAATQVLAAQYARISVVSDGGVWWISA